MIIFPEKLDWDNIVNFILDYESDTFSAVGQKITEAEADRVARIIVRDFLENKLDGTILDSALDIVRNEF